MKNWNMKIKIVANIKYNCKPSSKYVQSKIHKKHLYSKKKKNEKEN